MDVITGEGEWPLVLRLAVEATTTAREVACAPLLALSTRDRAALLDELAALERATAAARLAVLRALDGADLSELGATSLPALVSSRQRTPLGRARAEVMAARSTCPDRGDLPGVGAALLDGSVSREHVDVAVAVLDKVPHRIRRQAASTIDEFCADTSRRYRPREVANLAREILDRLDPDRGHDPDALTRRSFTLSADAYGMGLPSGQLDPATHALLRTALDHYAAPTPAQHDESGDAVFSDTRTPAQRRCDALAEIARRALAAAGTGAEGATRAGEAPRVVVHTTAEQMTGADHAGTVDCEAVGPVPAAFLRGLLCDCVVQKVVIAPTGAVLDLGRAARTATPGQRRALHARDRGCVWPGCTVPARWTDVHHVTAWVHGGLTDVGELALLCGAHHVMVEHGHFELAMLDGVPHVRPPAWVDPERALVRNTYWMDQQRAATTGRQLALDLSVGSPTRPDDTS